MAGKRRADTDLNHDNWDQEEETEEPGSFQMAAKDVLKDRVIKTARRRVAPGSSEGSLKNAFVGFGGFSKSTPVSTSPQFTFLKSLTNGKIDTPKTNGLSLFNTSDSNKNKDEKASGSPGTTLSTPSALFSFKPSTDSPNTSKTSSSPSTATTAPSTLLNFKGSADSTDTSNKPDKTSEYHSKLKSLNESVSKWIKQHVDTNPICILTPIFKDYEKHLTDIESKCGVSTDQSSKTSIFETKSEQKPETSTAHKIESNFSFGSQNKSAKSSIGTFQFGQKTVAEKSKAPETISNSIFGNSPLLKPPSDKAAEPQENKSSPFVTPFSNTSAFSFGNKSLNSASTSPIKGFSFDSGKPFAFANVSAPNKTDAEKNEEVADEEDEPPKTEFTPVVEDGSIHSVRCKVFAKKGVEFVERGVGQLYLKPVEGSEKTQLIVRADTNLGNLLINTLVSKSMPTSKKGKNNVMIVCIPTPESKPPPVTILIKVKTSDDADKLLELLEKHKK